MASSLANAATRSLIDGSDFGDNMVASLPDVVGQTIGEAIAGGISGNASTTGDREGRGGLFSAIGDVLGFDGEFGYDGINGPTGAGRNLSLAGLGGAIGDVVGLDGQFGQQGMAGRNLSLSGLGDAFQDVIEPRAATATGAYGSEGSWRDTIQRLTELQTGIGDATFAVGEVEADALWLDIDTTSDGGEWVLTPDPDGYGGTVRVPRPSLAPLELNGDTPRFHRYPPYVHRIVGGEDVPSYILDEILRENAVPNDWSKPATLEGVNNDAAALFGIPVLASQVISYERVSDTGKYWVLNVTRSVLDGFGADGGLHSFSSGWVTSTMRRNRDGTVDLLTYGEGNSRWQSPDSSPNYDFLRT
jgi:hypothetical protein